MFYLQIVYYIKKSADAIKERGKGKQPKRDREENKYEEAFEYNSNEDKELS